MLFSEQELLHSIDGVESTKSAMARIHLLMDPAVAPEELNFRRRDSRVRREVGGIFKPRHGLISALRSHCARGGNAGAAPRDRTGRGRIIYQGQTDKSFNKSLENPTSIAFFCPRPRLPPDLPSSPPPRLRLLAPHPFRSFEISPPPDDATSDLWKKKRGGERQEKRHGGIQSVCELEPGKSLNKKFIQFFGTHLR